ncbi:helix-turn-helix domain-containing protein [Pantoea ananatis]|uniref:helix-turn-helix domain-containing protein n=1 Tax=Pantoea ananas TaxID=553 RepID=UPI003B6420CA
MLVTMSNKELHRLSVIPAVIEKRLRRRDAAFHLDLSERQVQRVLRRYREYAAASIVSERRGRPGNTTLTLVPRLPARNLASFMTLCWPQRPCVN